MFYSKQVKTHIIDPVSSSNSRTELRLDSGNIYGSNFRITDFGSILSSGHQRYVGLGGITSLIKNIYLMDGNQVLDQLQNTHEFLAIKHLKRSNEDNASLMRMAEKTALGFELREDGTLQENLQINTVVPIPQGYRGEVTDDPDDTALGWLSLKECFGFLEASSYVDTDLFPNLRVIIEWRSDIANCVMGDQSGVTGDIQHPVLIVDELMDQQKIAEMRANKGSEILYMGWELERFFVNQVATDTKQNLNVNSRAYDNKFLDQIYYINYQPDMLNNNGQNIVKGEHSKAYRLEKLQLSVNGKNLLPFDGVNSPARKLAYMVDLGDTNQNLFTNEYSRDTNGDAQTTGIDTDSANYRQNVSYGQLVVAQRINNLQVQYERYGMYGGESPAFELHIFGRVARKLVHQGGTYKVFYA